MLTAAGIGALVASAHSWQSRREGQSARVGGACCRWGGSLGPFKGEDLSSRDPKRVEEAAVEAGSVGDLLKECFNRQFGGEGREMGPGGRGHEPFRRGNPEGTGEALASRGLLGSEAGGQAGGWELGITEERLRSGEPTKDAGAQAERFFFLVKTKGVRYWV